MVAPWHSGKAVARCTERPVSMPPPEKGASVSVDPKHTAVVLIEYQNDFTSEGGALHGAVEEVMEKTGMLENTRRLVDAARAAGATIVYAPITFAPGYGELSDGLDTATRRDTRSSRCPIASPRHRTKSTRTRSASITRCSRRS
jgi:nicotinamidase-related amidase